MGTLSPLDRFRIASTDDIKEAEGILSGKLTDARIKKVGNRKKFSLKMNGVSFGRTQLYFNEYSDYTYIDPGQVEEAVLLVIAYNNPSVVHIDQKPVICKDHSAVILSPSKRILIERPANSGYIILRSSYDAIKQRYQEHTGRNLTPAMIFENSVDLSNNTWSPLHSTIEFLLKTLQDTPGIMENPFFRKGFDDMLLSGLLSLPNNYYEQLNQCTHIITPDIIRHAEEFMEAKALEPITISDINNACCCSRAGLFKAFQKFRNYSPIQFLTGKRLDSARLQLLDSSSNSTVTSIAYRCGFTHLGRFSAAYRKKFGESPSQTLKSNR